MSFTNDLFSTTGCIVGVVPQHAPFNWNVATFFICKSKPGAQFNVVPFQLESLPQDEAAVILGALEDQPQFLVYENGQRAVLERSDSEKFFEALKTATPYFDEYAMGSAVCTSSQLIAVGCIHPESY
jgi:hypothetical protein